MPPKVATTSSTAAASGLAYPTLAEAPPSEFKDWIATVKAYLASSSPTKVFPTIYPRMIHFFDSADKANWEKYIEGAEHAATLNQVYHESWADPGLSPDRIPKTRILLVTTPIGNWVRKPAGAAYQWHTWAIVEIKKQSGKHGKRLYIMDPDLPHEFQGANLTNTGFKEMGFNNSQRKVLRHIYDKAPSTTEVWVGRPGEATTEERRCVRNTCKWIDELVRMEDKGWVEGEEDDRFPGFQMAKPTFG